MSANCTSATGGSASQRIEFSQHGQWEGALISELEKKASDIPVCHGARRDRTANLNTAKAKATLFHLRQFSRDQHKQSNDPLDAFS